MFSPHYRICYIGFLFDFAIMIAMIATPFFVYQQLGGGVAMSGAFGASQAAVYLLTCLIASRFVSKAKNGLYFALVGVAVFTTFFCGMSFFRNPWLCGTLAALAFGSLALAWPAFHSWVGAEPDPIKRTRRLGWFNVAWSFGFAMSPLLAGPLVDLDYRFAFLAVFGIDIVVFLMILSMPHESTHFEALTEETLQARVDHDRESEGHLYYAWFATMVINALIGISRNVYPKHVANLVETGELRLFFESQPYSFIVEAAATKYSWLAAGSALATALAFLLLGKTNRWRHNFNALMLIQVAAAVAFWSLGSTHSLAVMMLGFIVLGLNLGMAFFASVYYSIADPQKKHARASINEGMVGLGGFMGSMLFGQLVGRYGVALPFHYAPIVLLLAIILQWLLLHYGRKRAALRYAPTSS